MIAKTFALTKEIRAVGANSLRERKILRDHGGARGRRAALLLATEIAQHFAPVVRIWW